MNKEQFIYWLKGFTKAVNEEGPTQGQWRIIASELNKIEDCPNYGSPIGEAGSGSSYNIKFLYIISLITTVKFHNC